MLTRSKNGSSAGRRIAGYALGAMLQTPLYLMFLFLIAGFAGQFMGGRTSNGLRLLLNADNATFAVAAAGVFAVLFLLCALIAPRALRQRVAKGDSEKIEKRSVTPLGAVFADDTLSTREKLSLVLTTFPGVMQAAAFVLLFFAIGFGRLYR